MESNNQVLPLHRLKQEGRLSKDVVAVRIDGRIVDLLTPVPADAAIEPIRDSEPEGLHVIRHSTAHVMADAVQRLFPGTKVTIGPAIEDGFYYDFDKPRRPLHRRGPRQDRERRCARSSRQDTPFRREVVTREAGASTLFEKMGETFKRRDHRTQSPAAKRSRSTATASRGAASGSTSAKARTCPTTGNLGAVKLTSVAGAYWRGDERNPMLQRIYGTAFAKRRRSTSTCKLLEEAKARDHRKLGKELELFMFHEYAPAMPFFLPRGAFVYNRLVEYMRGLYVEYGYEEVITPQMFDKRLFETSGHLANYSENMYFACGPRTSSVKPSKTEPSTKAHRQLEAPRPQADELPEPLPHLRARRRSYRELPWRVADFGRLHRYERGGVVHGLARVRSFCQDDAHIFCTPTIRSQQRFSGFIELFYGVYAAFEFEKIDVKLATRPEKRIGTDEEWDRAEKALADALERRQRCPSRSPRRRRVLRARRSSSTCRTRSKRSWQLGTIQLDYACPSASSSSTRRRRHDHRPVMLHRAIFGSLERFFGVYIEHWPAEVPGVARARAGDGPHREREADEYAGEVAAAAAKRAASASRRSRRDKLGAKIRNARMLRYPYIGVVGDKEAAGAHALRSLDDKKASSARCRSTHS